MRLIDTHTHLYDEKFDPDREDMLARAIEAGVTRMLLPAVDSESHEALIGLARNNPESCYAMIGLHPTSVNGNADFRKELEWVDTLLKNPPVRFYGVGETGLDLYWSRDFLREQEEALRFQIELALEYDLPIVIHTRDAFDDMIRIISEYRKSGLRGVFHSFAGTEEQYHALRDSGDFCFGIGGVITYKNSLLPETVARMKLEDIVLETDAPYLPPVPFRGKRNESSYLVYIAEKMAEVKHVPVEEIARVTTQNAERMFGI